MAKTISQSAYDGLVAKYGKAKADSAMKAKGATVKRDPIKATEVTEKEDGPSSGTGTVSGGHTEEQIPYDYRVDRADGNLSAEDIAQNKKADESDAARARARARALEAKRKKAFESLIKKGGGSDNVLSNYANKYGVNSDEYKKAKKEITRYEGVKSTVRTNVAEKETKFDEKTGLSQTQYNKVISQYGNTDSAIAAAANKYGKNSSQVKKFKELLSKFDAPKSEKIRENLTVVTDVKKSEFKGNSIVDYLNSTKQGSTFSDRAKLAKLEGITAYRGTAEQNKQLLDSLKNKESSSKAETPEIKTTSDESIPESEKITDIKKDKKITTAERKQGVVDSLNKRRLAGETDEDILGKIGEKFGNDSEEYKKVKTFMEENPEKTGEEGVDVTLLDKSKEELEQAQIESLESIRDDNISTTTENFIKGSELISKDNETLQEFYKNMAIELNTFLETAKATKAAALERTKSSALNKVVSQIRATLARKGVDIGKIAPEQLIAMSGELGSKAMDTINEAITTMETEIINLTQANMTKINQLKEQGLIKDIEAGQSIEQMRQLKEKMISDIKGNFISNTFKIAQASAADKDTTKAEVMNTVSTFVSNLGISGTAQGIMETYINSEDSITALNNMIKDLNDENSDLFKAVDDVEKSNQLAAEFKAKIELMKATKATSSGSTASKGTKLSSTVLPKLAAASYDSSVNLPELREVRTIEEYNLLLTGLPEEKRVAIEKSIGIIN